MATLYERAFQIWPLLIHAARSRQILTYTQVADCTGMFTGGLGPCLEPIQSYCIEEELPPLTMLVVSEGTGLPGTGFTGADISTPEDFARTLQTIFRFDWNGKAPEIRRLEVAAARTPSNG